MRLLTFLQESKIPKWKTYANMYFLQHNQDPGYYVMTSLLESLHSHYRLQMHALHGSAPIAEAKFVRFKKMKEKRKIKILVAKALATLVEGNNICIRCNASFKPLVSHQTWCSKCHPPKKKDAKALEAARLLPEAAAAQLLAKQNKKHKKKHATEKGRNFKQRGNVVFVLPPGRVANGMMAIRKKKVSSKSIANRAAIRAKDSSASVSKDVYESEHSDSDSGSDAHDMRNMLHKSSDDSSAGDDSEEDDSSASVNSESAFEDMTSLKDIREMLMSYGIVKVPLCTSFEVGSKSEEDASARLQAQTVRMGKRYVEPALEMDTGFGASSLDEVQAFNVYCASSSAGMGASSRGAMASTAVSSTSSSSKCALELFGTVSFSLHTSLHAHSANANSDSLQYPLHWPLLLQGNTKFFGIVDTEATNYLVPEAMYLSNVQESHESVSWENNSSSRATGIGSLYGITAGSINLVEMAFLYPCLSLLGS